MNAFTWSLPFVEQKSAPFLFFFVFILRSYLLRLGPTLLIFADFLVEFFFLFFSFSADLTRCLPNTLMIPVTEMLLAI